MELCLVIPIIGLFIIALSIVFFLLAFISTKCYNKLKNIKVFYLYCLFLLIIGFLILLISVNPENEENLLEKLKDIIYDIDDKYSPCKEKKDQDENNKDHKEFDKENQTIYNKRLTMAINTKTYISKSNTIVKGSNVNLALNPIMELNYGIRMEWHTLQLRKQKSKRFMLKNHMFQLLGTKLVN
jgi:hypothetical protein